MSRAAAERRGRRAEWTAALWLTFKGYRILARRVRTPVGEVDLVARRGRTLVFVEVKARTSVDRLTDALDGHALARVHRAANLLLSRFGRGCESMRIDAIVVAPRRWPRHLTGLGEGDWR